LALVSSTMNVAEFLVEIERSSGLLLETEADTYSFAHLTIQEYLTAMYLKETGHFDYAVIELNEVWWHETLAGQLLRASP